MMQRTIAWLIVGLLWLYSSPMACHADGEKTTDTNDQTAAADPLPADEPESEKGRIEGKTKNIGVAPIPIIFYTPETSFAIGGGVVFTFRDSNHPNDNRPDSLRLIAAYTMKNQIFFSLTPEIYFNEKIDKITINTNYSHWPSSFFGIGNDSGIDADTIDDLEEVYTRESFMVRPWILHRTVSHLSIGITMDVKRSNISDIEDGGLLDQGRLTGANGGIRSGLGPVLSWDTRDAIFYPTRGSWYNIWSWHYRNAWGSDFDYDVYALDLRHYWTITDDHILALHALGISTDGEVPFDELPTPIIRGLYENLFVDEHMFTLEMEYRFPIHERWSGATFAAVGDVFHDPENYEIQDIKYAGGGGIRYAISEEDKINLRFDIGVSPYGVFPYVLFQEAF